MMTFRQFLARLLRDGEKICRAVTSARSTNSQTKCIACFSFVRPKNKFPLREQPAARRRAFHENDAFRENYIKHRAVEKGYTADSQNWSQIELEHSRRLDFLSPKNL